MFCSKRESNQVTYAVPISPPKSNETAVYRNVKSLDKLIEYPEEGLRTMQDIYINAYKKFSNKPCLGSRDITKNNKYTFRTYKQIIDLSARLGVSIQEYDLAPLKKEYEDYEVQFLGVYSKNREEYGVLEISAAIFGYVTVPIYDTLGADAFSFILNQTNLETVFLSEDCLNSFFQKQNDIGNVKNLVVFESNIPNSSLASYFQKAQDRNLKILFYKDLVQPNKISSLEDILDKKLLTLPSLKPSSILTFSYTSGTTGDPKGAMISHGNMVSVLSCMSYVDRLQMNPDDIHLSYLPMAHVFEKLNMAGILTYGGRIGFYCGDILKIRDDLSDLKPTMFPSVPRIFNKMYDTMMTSIKALTPVKKFIAGKAIESKLFYLNNGVHYEHRVYDKLVFRKIKAVFGGQVRKMITASAPIAQDVLSFLKIAGSCPVFEAYGQTESCGASCATDSNDPVGGHVGGPIVNTELKLVDVEDMQYTSQDKDSFGNLTPRGEICLRGPSIFLGYYKDRKKTDEVLDSDGWLHTGDIGQLNQNGSLKIIDRIKNIFKLSQGEYVATEKIEIIYNNCQSVEESFVYGDSLQHFIVGFVVPKERFINQKAKELNIQKTYPELLNDKQIKQAVLDEMVQYGKSQKLLGFEQVKKIKLLSQSFQEYNLLTTTSKLKRHEAKIIFKNEIEALYGEN